MIKVRLHSNEKQAADATDKTIRSLPSVTGLPHFIKRDNGGEILFDDDGLATIITPEPKFIRFALEQQGYVKEIVE